MVTLRSLDDQIQISLSEGQNVLLGRLGKCDVVLEDASVSSQHARLRLRGNRLRVVDMGSTNGTRVNYSPLVGPGYLQDGDTVEFGNVTFAVDGPSLEAPPVADPGSPMATADLEPLDASQELSETMVNIDVPPEEELEELATGAAGEVYSEGEGPTPLLEETVRTSYLTALALILVGGILLLVALWMSPPLP